VASRVPSLNWLRVFEAAARTGSFARAAERLAMSPPAVSQQIRALEDHLRQPLFERAAAGVTLTQAGRSLLVAVGEPLGRMEAAAAAMAAPGRAPLIVGASLILSAGWLSPRLSKFMAADPQLSVSLRSLLGHPETPARDVAIWIAFGQPPPGTVCERLFGEQLVPVAHPGLSGEIDAPKDMLAHRLIEVSDHRRSWAAVFGLDVLPEPARVTHVDTTLTALTLAAGGAGIALARPPASDALVSALGLEPCLPDFAIFGLEEYHLLSPAGSQLARDALLFKDWVIEEARETRADAANRGVRL